MSAWRESRSVDEEAVEVLQHLPPEVVDGAVTLVGNDDVDVSMGTSGLYSTGAGSRRSASLWNPESSSSSGSSSSPFRMEYTRWMVEMQTLLTESI